MHAATKSSTPDGMNDYAYDGYNKHTISEEYNSNTNDNDNTSSPERRAPPNSSFNNHRMNAALPAPSDQSTVPRKPIQLGNSLALDHQGGELPPQRTARPEQPEKRRSWLKRRLSKRA